MRYNRLRDIGLTEQQIKDNLLFTTDKVGETMKAAIDPEEAKGWFGATPPTSPWSRARAPAAPRAAGPTTCTPTCAATTATTPRPPAGTTSCSRTWACPHVLWELQASSAAVYVEEKDPHDPRRTPAPFRDHEQITPGTLTPRTAVRRAVADLVAFLQWMGEPARRTSAFASAWVLIFLGCSP